MVIPKQMTMKPMTRVMILVAEALRPLKSTMVVMMEKNVTGETSLGGSKHWEEQLYLQIT